MTSRSIRRALLSVSDKTGLVDFAKTLVEFDIELVSTGGTAALLSDAGLPVRDVAELTGFPEMMDGRVKTLHPVVHGGLLSVRDNPVHQQAQLDHNIGNIDLLVVNLYPFEATVAKGADRATCIENIDIGGPAMIRSAAKNHADVTVIVDVSDYETVVTDLKQNSGETSLELRQQLAAVAYARTAAYDTAISTWFANDLEIKSPRRMSFTGELVQTLRYGENPHQEARFYASGLLREGVATARQVQGKELSFNNINDTDAAFECVSEFNTSDHAAVAIIKHANPCGVALADSLIDAYKHALRCDSTSAFGGIVALNREIDGATAEEITRVFTEVIIAPGADEDALKIIAAKKNLRLLLTQGLADPATHGVNVRSVAGGYLVQSRDAGIINAADLKVVTERLPTDQELADMTFAFKVAKHVKSNAIIYVKDGATVGIGAGQMSRVDSARIAAHKAAEAARLEGQSDSLAKGSVVASDAFFPFADGLLTAIEAGATAVIQPGGSMRDDEVIAAANEANIAMVFTGMRHFRH